MAGVAISRWPRRGPAGRLVLVHATVEGNPTMSRSASPSRTFKAAVLTATVIAGLAPALAARAA